MNAFTTTIFAEDDRRTAHGNSRIIATLIGMDRETVLRQARAFVADYQARGIRARDVDEDWRRSFRWFPISTQRQWDGAPISDAFAHHYRDALAAGCVITLTDGWWIGCRCGCRELWEAQERSDTFKAATS